MEKPARIRNRQITIRVSEKGLERLQTIRRDADVTISEVLRACLAIAAKYEDEVRDRLKDFS